MDPVELKAKEYDRLFRLMEESSDIPDNIWERIIELRRQAAKEVRDER